MLPTDEQVKGWIDEACVANGCKQISDSISWEWNRRYIAKAGMATTRILHMGGKITLSIPIMYNMTEAQQRETVMHETCHIIANNLHATHCNHDDRWKQCMRRCGLEPKRCHNIRLEIPGRYVDAACACGTIKVGKIVASRIRQGRSYLCNSCKRKVTLC